MASSDQIRAYLERKFGRTIGVDEPLLDSGILDSVGIFELVLFLEETFGVDIQDETIIPEHFETINLISAFVDGKRDGTPR